MSRVGEEGKDGGREGGGARLIGERGGGGWDEREGDRVWYPGRGF